MKNKILITITAVLALLSSTENSGAVEFANPPIPASRTASVHAIDAIVSLMGWIRLRELGQNPSRGEITKIAERLRSASNEMQDIYKKGELKESDRNLTAEEKSFNIRTYGDSFTQNSLSEFYGQFATATSNLAELMDKVSQPEETGPILPRISKQLGQYIDLAGRVTFLYQIKQ